ncbi:hypothetical protein [Streptomyces sp. H27-D2]|uniref:hypothetical protein n=1 Tax=Streptomyces sp. H27-D2 TaxID=3046304 RepID=UPI002DBD7B9E|nr:hypothetical protein [Streptomyces sp. H27-D2]MEC4017674.1 hypothetical protein [Streptomyces sp. H27-D2]
MTAGAIAVALPATAAWPTAPASAAPGRTVDLSLSADSPSLAPGHTGAQRLTIRNRGPNAVAGKVQVTYVTPFYININHSAPLPAGCTMRLTKPDPTIPEVVSCKLNKKIPAGGKATLDMPLSVTKRARFVGPDQGSAMVAPLGGQTDPDLTGNAIITFADVAPPSPALAPGANKVNLWLSHDVPTLANPKAGPIGPDSTVTFTYGNQGPKPMRQAARLTFVTPFYTNLTRLPQGCAYQLQDKDPLIPEVITCDVQPLSVDSVGKLPVPVSMVAGAPRGHIYSQALIAPATTTDADTDQIDNLDAPGVLNITAKN